MPMTMALRDQVTRFFLHRQNLIVAMDTGFLMHHKSVMVTGLILMTLAVPIALVLPGNKVLLLGAIVMVWRRHQSSTAACARPLLLNTKDSV